jgi:predicted permease
MKSDRNIGIYQYALIFSNVTFMGYPVVRAVLGEQGIFYTAIYNLPFNLLSFTLGVYLLSKGSKDFKFSPKELINPSLISVFLGLLLFITGLRLPTFVNNSLDLLGSVTTPISMLVIGSMLSTSSAKECFMNKKLYILCFIRLIFLPVIIYLAFMNRIEDSLIAAIPVVITSMPTAANTAIMANQYDADVTIASQCVFMTTLFSVITIPLVNLILLG